MADLDDANADEPPFQGLVEEQARFARDHRTEVHDGGPCVCIHDVFSTEAPF